ncbi:MAG: WD40 repeat domain-containing protein [Planctomycetota bacterium]|jgi:WD40 repeat protein
MKLSLPSALCRPTACLLLGLGALGAPAQAQISPQVEWSFKDVGLVGAIRTVDFSPNGQYVAYAAEFTREIMIRRTSDGALVGTLSGSANMGVSEAAFAPDGSAVASTWSILGWVGTVFGGAETFGPGSAGPILTTTDHDEFVTSLAWSPDSLSILTASVEGKADLVDAATGLQLLEVDHGVEIRDVAFSPDGLSFATAGVDGVVNIWDATTGLLSRSIVAHLGAVSQIEFNPDNIHIATGGGAPLVDTAINIYQYASGTFVTSHSLQSEEITGLVFMGTGNRLMSADYSSILRISDAAAPVEYATIDVGRGPRLTSLDLHEGQRRYVWGTGDGWVTMASR